MSSGEIQIYYNVNRSALRDNTTLGNVLNNFIILYAARFDCHLIVIDCGSFEFIIFLDKNKTNVLCLFLARAQSVIITILDVY